MRDGKDIIFAQISIYNVQVQQEANSLLAQHLMEE